MRIKSTIIATIIGLALCALPALLWGGSTKVAAHEQMVILNGVTKTVLVPEDFPQLEGNPSFRAVDGLMKSNPPGLCDRSFYSSVELIQILYKCHSRKYLGCYRTFLFGHMWIRLWFAYKNGEMYSISQDEWMEMVSEFMKMREVFYCSPDSFLSCNPCSLSPPSQCPVLGPGLSLPPCPVGAMLPPYEPLRREDFVFSTG